MFERGTSRDGERRRGTVGASSLTVSHRLSPSLTAPASNVAEELRAGTDRLRLAGIPHPGREALAMWAALAGSTPGAAWAAADTPAPPDLVERFREAVARRSAGEPRAYAVGLAGFRTLDLVVDGRVLIPRPETEGLVDRVLAWAGKRWGRGTGNRERGTVQPVALPFPLPRSPFPDAGCRSWGSVLDLGTGSGCIALSLAAEGAFTRIVATDVSADALAVAAINTERTEAAARVDLRHGALFDPVAGERFDAIVSNPPYLTTAELAGLEASVRDFEPAVALAAGADGMEQTRAILRSAGHHLAGGGLLALEVDRHRAGLVLAEARAGGWDARIEQDLWGRERYLLATRKATDNEGKTA